MNANNKQVKSKKRVTDHGEVFTSEREVRSMLDLVKQETERIESRFFEPACGDGNFLHEILQRKFDVVEKRYSTNQADYNKYMILSLSSIYGVELLDDNAKDCRQRLFDFFIDTYFKIQKILPNHEISETAKFILERNILCGDALTLLSKDGQPIVFSEWSIVSGDNIKRRDFKLAEMLMFPPKTKEETKLHNDYYMEDLFSDEALNNTTIRVYKEYPITKYWRIYEFNE